LLALVFKDGILFLSLKTECLSLVETILKADGYRFDFRQLALVFKNKKIFIIKNRMSQLGRDNFKS
jgi:hydroxyacyl-ACP dehydratase HTD2-like protein with hotdog domain